jgi:glutathione synthase/RimK-type ligase-like ATP-grasp enzyme
VWQVWDDPTARWDDGFVAIRSTWDYTKRRAAFLAWARQVPQLANPADIVEWNSDKVYLRALAEAGLPVVPTAWAGPDEPVSIPFDGEVVVKPSVGAGSRGAGRFGPDQRADALEHAAALQAAGRTVMVQPYLSGVDEAGETALLFFAGRFSHAIRKAPLLEPGVRHSLEAEHLWVPETITPREPGAAELAVAQRVVDHIGPLLYTRVDLLPTPDGPVVVELELVEPSLFLTTGGEDAAGRFAAAVAGAAGAR